MVFGQGDQTVQAYAPERAQEPLTQGIGLGALGWGLQYLQTEVAHTLVEVPGEDRIPIVDENTIGVVSRDRFTQLLERPRGRGVCGRIDVQDAAYGMFHHH